MMRKIQRDPNGSAIFAPGQDLVVAGVIGKAGVRAALEKYRGKLEARFCEAFMRSLQTALEEQVNLGADQLAALGATEWESIEEGGVLAALWNISGAYQQGITFSLLDMPVCQEMIEVCEFADLNPFRLRSGDCLLIVVNHGADAVRALAELGIRAQVIGKVQKGIARTMTGVSGTGYLEKPQPDEIYKIIGES